MYSIARKAAILWLILWKTRENILKLFFTSNDKILKYTYIEYWLVVQHSQNSREINTDLWSNILWTLVDDFQFSFKKTDRGQRRTFNLAWTLTILDSDSNSYFVSHMLDMFEIDLHSCSLLCLLMNTSLLCHQYLLSVICIVMKVTVLLQLRLDYRLFVFE